MTFFAFQIQDHLACAYGTNFISAGDMHDSKKGGWFAVSELSKLAALKTQ